jgi:phosphatidylinositol alpha-1,6-mannosyltransferase
MSVRKRSRRAPVLATFTQTPGRGGIARVSALLWQVMMDTSENDCKVVAVSREGTAAGAVGKVRFTCRLAAEQVSGGVDWIVFDQLGLARVQRVIPARFRRPYAVFLHSVEVWQPLASARLHVLRNATVRMANSEYTVARFSDVNPGVGPIEVCHLALLPRTDLTFDGAVDRALVGRIGPKAILIVGRILSAERHKGHDRLIRAWPGVLASVPDAQLIIVGEGDDLPRLRRAVCAAGLERSVLCTGHVNERTLDALYSAAAVYAMPSSGEGFGLVFLEAMARGLPCIGSLADASREIVVHGETGFLIDPADSAAVVRSIVVLLESAELRTRLGLAGMRRLKAQFSFERFRARVSAALQPLAGHYADTQANSLR